MNYGHGAGRPPPRLQVKSRANLFVPASSNLYAAVCKAARALGELYIESDPQGRAGSWVPRSLYEEIRGRGVDNSTRHAPVP